MKKEKSLSGNVLKKKRKDINTIDAQIRFVFDFRS